MSAGAVLFFALGVAGAVVPVNLRAGSLLKWGLSAGFAAAAVIAGSAGLVFAGAAVEVMTLAVKIAALAVAFALE